MDFQVSDLVGWIGLGFGLGGVVAAQMDGGPMGAPLGILIVGLVGSIVGGGAWSLLFGDGPWTLIGSLIVGLGLAVLTFVTMRHEQSKVEAF